MPFLRVLGGGSRLIVMGMPETRYARSGDVMVAYQVLGEGPFDVVIVPGAVSHVEVQWEAAARPRCVVVLPSMRG